MDDDTPVNVDETYNSLTRTLATLVRRGRIPQQGADAIKPVIDYVYNSVKGHTACPASAAVLVSSSKYLIDVLSLVMAFEDHLESHDAEEPKKPTPAESVSKIEGDVIHVDFKGKVN